MKHTHKWQRGGMIVASLACLTLAGCVAMPGSKATAKAWMTECGMTAAQMRCIFHVTKKYNASTGVSDRFTLKKFRHIYKTAAAWRKTSGRYCPKLAKKERQRIYQTAKSCVAAERDQVHGSVGLKEWDEVHGGWYRHNLLEQVALKRMASGRREPRGTPHVRQKEMYGDYYERIREFAKGCPTGVAAQGVGAFTCASGAARIIDLRKKQPVAKVKRTTDGTPGDQAH
jgi:hypothetical protein